MTSACAGDRDAAKRLVRALVVVVVVAAFASGARAQQAAVIPPELAARYFAEARAMCEQDDGKLWGVSLCGPVLFADRATRTAVADRADGEGVLVERGGVFVGVLPPRINVANTAIEWAGVRWTMIVWSPPADERSRRRLLAHELWHRVQAELGLTSVERPNAHLDTLDGRVWLQLEWRALRRALLTSGADRRRAISDALLFREHRRRLFPSAADDERALEMNEGLAEYTGILLSGTQTPALDAAANMNDISRRATFVRSFAYATGPAYGLLLDGTGKSWRSGLKTSDDLGALLRSASGVRAPRDPEQRAARRAEAYGAGELVAAETRREQDRRRAEAAYRARLIAAPVLVIPLRRMNMSFDPNTLVPLGSEGTVYPAIRIADVWGVLTVTTGGALLHPSFADVRVPLSPVPRGVSERPLRGDGWTLELTPGWTLAPGEREGDYTIKRQG